MEQLVWTVLYLLQTVCDQSRVFLLSEKRIIQAQAEKEGMDSDLSSMFPKVSPSFNFISIQL